MLRNLISFCLSRRPLALVAFAAFLGLGYAAFLTLNVEAYPDPAFGRFGNPVVAVAAKGLRGPGGPARKILRPMREVVDLAPVAADGDADGARFEGSGHVASSDVGREFGVAGGGSLE